MIKNNIYTVGLDSLKIIASTKKPFWKGSENERIKEPICISKNVILLPDLTKGNPAYDACYKIQLNKELIANIYWGADSKLRYKCDNPTKIEVLKSVLYESEWPEKLNFSLQELNLNFYKYNYAEIAIDGYNLIAKQLELMNSKDYHRKQPLENAGESRNEAKGFVSGIRLGSPNSDKKISLYPQQLTLKNHEEYIKEFWERNNLPIVEDKQIDRNELRLTGKLANLLSRNFNDLNNPQYLAAFFKEYGGHYLEYINNTDKEKRMHIIDWGKFEKMKLEKPIKIEPVESNIPFKPVIKKLFFEFHVTKMKYYFNSYIELAKKHKLTDWLAGKTDNWLRELRIK